MIWYSDSERESWTNKPLTSHAPQLMSCNYNYYYCLRIILYYMCVHEVNYAHVLHDIVLKECVSVKTTL